MLNIILFFFIYIYDDKYIEKYFFLIKFSRIINIQNNIYTELPSEIIQMILRPPIKRLLIAKYFYNNYMSHFAASLMPYIVILNLHFCLF